MTISAQGIRAGRQPQAKPTHRFHIGQTVRMRSHFGISASTAELFRITGTLPARDNSPQYRIRNDGERHERVATEDSLELVAAQTAVGADHVERTFMDDQGTETQHSQAGDGSRPAAT